MMLHNLKQGWSFSTYNITKQIKLRQILALSGQGSQRWKMPGPRILGISSIMFKL